MTMLRVFIFCCIEASDWSGAILRVMIYEAMIAFRLSHLDDGLILFGGMYMVCFVI